MNADDIMNKTGTKAMDLLYSGHYEGSTNPEIRYTRAYVFSPNDPATICMVEAGIEAVKHMTKELCSPLYRHIAEVAELHLSPDGITVFYTRPTRESGVGRNYRWRAAYGCGMDEFLLGPAVLVAMNIMTGEIRDFTPQEEEEVIRFDRRDYRQERMFDLSENERVILTKGEIAEIGHTDSVSVMSQDWQFLKVRVEHENRYFTAVIPKAWVLSGEIELAHYKDGAPIR